jgi:hypothetical protein
MEKLVVCMKWGDRYGAEYVNRLWRSVRRHVSGDVRLVCFTDDATGVVGEVDCRPLPAFEGVRADLAVKPWRKLSLWMKDLGPDLAGRDALFLDLDVVVVGSLDGFWDFEPGKYVVWENPTKKGSGIGNTSVFRFKVGAHPEIYEHFMADPVGLYEREFRIEQEYISAVLGSQEPGSQVARFQDSRGAGIRWAQREQRFWPGGWCVSFKEDLLPGWPWRFWVDVARPAGANVVVFHGKPDPDEARDGKWPAKGWKKLYKYVRPVRWIETEWAEGVE